MLKFQKLIERFQVEYHSITTIFVGPNKNPGNMIIGFSSSVYNYTFAEKFGNFCIMISVSTGEKFKGGTN